MAPAPPAHPAGLRSGSGSHHSYPSLPIMASRVAFSDSDTSGSSVTSHIPNPPLRSLVVAPAGLELGSRGWDAGAGPSHPVPAAPADAGGWQTWHPRRRRSAVEAPRLQSRRPLHQPQRLRQLPAARPPANGAYSRVPSVLHGCCYNCGEEGHIASQCDNPTLCVRCGGTEHIAKHCHKRPRSDSDAPPPRARAPPPLPPRLGLLRLVRSWPALALIARRCPCPLALSALGATSWLLGARRRRALPGQNSQPHSLRRRHPQPQWISLRRSRRWMPSGSTSAT
jgi:hypothetical protein